jgi:GPH family glycoside/pentoside/hexuronide:cation symporter
MLHLRAGSLAKGRVMASLPKLPLINKLLYASDMVGSQAVAQTRNLWLLFFLAPPRNNERMALVPALDWGLVEVEARVLAGGLLTAGRIIEAFDDPIIGWWSDRTKSRWGRRIPFILLATPFYAIFFALLWLNPTSEASLANAICFFVVLEIFFLATTLSGGPYESLIAEVAKTQRDRVSIVAWQFYFGILGAALGLVLSGWLKDTAGFLAMGTTIAVFGLVFRYIGLREIWKAAPRETPPATIALKSAFKATLGNGQFLYFLPTFVFFQLSVGMVIVWLPFFVEEVLEAENEGTIKSVLTAAALVSMCVAVFFLWRLCDRRGKKWVYSFALLATFIYMPLLFFAGFIPGIPKLAQGIFIALLAGLPMAGVNLLPKAITADITDYDELRTGMRREGMFFAVQNLFVKIGSWFSALFLALVLLLGDTTEDPLGLRMAGPIAAAFAFLGFWLFRGYCLPSSVTRESVLAAGLRLPTHKEKV